MPDAWRSWWWAPFTPLEVAAAAVSAAARGVVRGCFAVVSGAGVPLLAFKDAVVVWHWQWVGNLQKRALPNLRCSEFRSEI